MNNYLSIFSTGSMLNISDKNGFIDICRYAQILTL